MRTRVILDTNVWSYIGDEDGADSLQELLDEFGCVVALVPSMVLELLRNPHRESRNRQIAAITGIRGDRLASDAELCAKDFISMVKRRRPNWKRAIADMSTVDKYHREWTRGVWRWAARDPDVAHESATADTDVAKVIVDVQRANRKSFLRENFESDYVHLVAKADSPLDAARYIPGWDGREIEGWRFDLAGRYWFQMATRIGNRNYNRRVQTHRDWIGSRIDLEVATADADDFARLWFDEVTPSEVPRDWIRGALSYTQTTMKIGRGYGNAADEQHSVYLLDAAHFLTADRALVTALKMVARQAEFRFARPQLVEYRHGTRPTVEAIRESLEAAIGSH